MSGAAAIGEDELTAESSPPTAKNRTSRSERQLRRRLGGPDIAAAEPKPIQGVFRGPRAVARTKLTTRQRKADSSLKECAMVRGSSLRSG
jgi:hypothetical protein